LDNEGEVIYKAAGTCLPQHDRSIRFDDPDIGVALPAAVFHKGRAMSRTDCELFEWSKI